jgi:hypothetical protein
MNEHLVLTLIDTPDGTAVYPVTAAVDTLVERVVPAGARRRTEAGRWHLDPGHAADLAWVADLAGWQVDAVGFTPPTVPRADAIHLGDCDAIRITFTTGSPTGVAELLGLDTTAARTFTLSAAGVRSDQLEHLDTPPQWPVTEAQAAQLADRLGDRCTIVRQGRA